MHFRVLGGVLALFGGFRVLGLEGFGALGFWGFGGPSSSDPSMTRCKVA